MNIYSIIVRIVTPESVLYLVNGVPVPELIDFPKLGFHCRVCSATLDRWLPDNTINYKVDIELHRIKLFFKSALIFLQNGSDSTVVSPLPETRCSLLPQHGSPLCVVKTPLFPHNNQ